MSWTKTQFWFLDVQAQNEWQCVALKLLFWLLHLYFDIINTPCTILFVIKSSWNSSKDVQLCVEVRKSGKDSFWHRLQCWYKTSVTHWFCIFFFPSLSDLTSYVLSFSFGSIVIQLFLKALCTSKMVFFAAAHSLSFFFYFWKKISAALAKCPKVYPLNCKYVDILCVPLGLATSLFFGWQEVGFFFYIHTHTQTPMKKTLPVQPIALN